ncbi:MAG: helix-turn-helix domain-containing protein [Patescibacteria group bacterium]|nr:helix-turn-helix domain-containing protein [Patescibacteria group bacterium]
MSSSIRLSVSEAARLFGISEKTLRRAIINKEINYIVVAGRYKLNFESLVKWSQQKTTVRRKSEKYGIDQFVDKWRLSATLYSPNPPATEQENNSTIQQ